MRITIAIVAVLAVVAVAHAAQNPAWARVYYDSAAAMERDILVGGMDVASGGEGYVDVVASAEELAGLQELGYRIEIIAEDAGAGLALLPPDMGLYHTYQEMLDELKQRESAYPDICKLYDVGDTWESREMWVLKISDNPTQTEAEPKLFVVGCHHAREIMTVEIALHFIKVLLTGYGTYPDIKYYVDNYEIYVMPMANPDGHVYVENNSGGSPDYWWRKNRRDNGGSYGVDLNRNYSYKWGYDDRGSSPIPSSSTYRGPAAFSEPETTALRGIMKDPGFDFVLDYHSYGEYILIPYSYDTLERAPNSERDYFLQIGNGMNTKLNNRYRVGTCLETLRYPVNGGSIDYHFGERTEKKKFYGWSFEVNTRTEGGFGPPESYIEPTCKEHEGVLMWFLDYMKEFVGVELAGFDGYARDGRAVLTWATANEYNHAGFNLYREGVSGTDEGRVKVNDEIIVGKSPYRFVDDDVEAGGSYKYYLEDVDLNGKGTLHGPVRVDMLAGAKTSFALAQNAPNPARATTTFAFSVPAACDATLTVYDIAGRKVATPFAGQAKAGENELAVDVSTLAPGVYTYRLEAGGSTAAKRMVVVR
jgi:hypothetical protein